jgi:predicted adenylyl cyclase CyaB
MNKKYKEVEIKLAIEDIVSFEKKLQKLDGKNDGEFFQRTIRFETPNDDLEKRGLFLRVRTGDKNIITVKRKSKEDKNYKERDEWETEVDDPETVVEIFKALGYTKLLIMEKYRKTYTFSDFPDLTVTIDRLPFGHFAEIEGGEEDIEVMLERLNLKTIERITDTYWGLHEQYNKERGLSGEDIVFSG